MVNNSKLHGKAPRNGHRYQVVTYIRVSHELQSDNHTFETQILRIREKLDARYGPDNYDIKAYQDEGLSGGYGPEKTRLQKRTRPTLKQIAADLDSGAYDCLAFYASSRMFRSQRWA
jgi:DNA invertase Pin-like site-specific DNA recombinase